VKQTTFIGRHFGHHFPGVQVSARHFTPAAAKHLLQSTHLIKVQWTAQEELKDLQKWLAMSISRRELLLKGHIRARHPSTPPHSLHPMQDFLTCRFR
jgi:hypothetical protein